jgi:two-component system phosphate regulon response regulator PhoB
VLSCAPPIHLQLNRPRILVIEDEKDVRDLILLHLKREGYDTYWAENGEEGLHLLEHNTYEAIVLDWMLPGISGLDLCRRIHQSINPKLPVLMVTARADTSDLVLGLEMGASDYITKPFEIPIFLARMRTLLRKTKQPLSPALHSPPHTPLKIGLVFLDTEAHRVTYDQQELFLTPSEFKILQTFMNHPGKVLSRERLLQYIQGGVKVIDRTIDTHIFGLRKKMKNALKIETIRGIGYRLELPH